MKDTMTPLERKQAILTNKPFDRLPITLFHPLFAAKLADMTYRESYSTPEKLAEREINIYHQLGIDEVTITYLSLKITNTLMIKDLDDVEKLDLDFYSFENDERQQINYQAAELIYKEIGDQVPISYGVSGPLTLARSLVPIETILKGTRKKPDRVHQLLRFTTDFLKQMADAFLDLSYLDYFIYEPVASASLISPKQYEEFCLPYTEELVNYLKKDKKDRLVHMHICGNTVPSLDLIAQTGIDGFSLDQEVDLTVAKEKIGNKLTLMGNVDPVSIFLQGAPEEMDQAVRICFEKAQDNPKGFIIRSGCGIPYETPIQNIQAYMEASRKYGVSSFK